MLKAAMPKTHISSQKTIVPTIAGTLRLMPMCCIDCGQAAALGGDLQADLLAQRGEQPGDEAGGDIADDEHDDHGHDPRGQAVDLIERLGEALPQGGFRTYSTMVVASANIASFLSTKKTGKRVVCGRW